MGSSNYIVARETEGTDKNGRDVEATTGGVLAIIAVAVEVIALLLLVVSYSQPRPVLKVVR